MSGTDQHGDDSDLLGQRNAFDVQPPPNGPITPSAVVRLELEQFLEADDSRVGEVYSLGKQGLSADQIAKQLDVSTSNFVWNCNAMIRAILDGDLPGGSSMALQTARRIRGMLKQGTLSLDAHRYLEANAELLDGKANDGTVRAAEVAQAVVRTQQAEARQDSGVYVYALPHYLRYPYDPQGGRTLLKVGRSDSDVIQRFRNQTRTTALPEEPILLRIYRPDTQTVNDLERIFHRLLVAADHHQSAARTAGVNGFSRPRSFWTRSPRS